MTPLLVAVTIQDGMHGEMDAHTIRVSVMVVVSTRNGMSSFTISMMVCGLFQPSFFGMGL